MMRKIISIFLLSILSFVVIDLFLQVYRFFGIDIITVIFFILVISVGWLFYNEIKK